jgi:sulfide:quinone oxidoreductase
MSLFTLSDTLSVSAQITVEDVSMLREQGFTVIVCNRPDGESLDQPNMEDVEAACVSAGMLFIRYPVNAMDFPGPDLQGLGALFDDPAQRVLAYCRTGTRCANLWIASRDEEALADAVAVSRGIGFDLSMALR